MSDSGFPKALVKEAAPEADSHYMLRVEEYLKTAYIPDSQRVYTGSDSGE